MKALLATTIVSVSLFSGATFAGEVQLKEIEKEVMEMTTKINLYEKNENTLVKKIAELKKELTQSENIHNENQELIKENEILLTRLSENSTKQNTEDIVIAEVEIQEQEVTVVEPKDENME
ncbi:MAG: hypothetical protein ACRCWQ_05465 [Bacilli bacterium]